ncbi:octopamine receptor beta-1R-like [Glandiceps talaboti]
MGINDINTTQTDNDHELQCDTKLTQAYITICIITFFIIVAIIFGNLLVILSVHRFRELQTVSNCFVCSLACADLIVIVTALFNAGLSLRGIPRKGSIYLCLLQSMVFQIGSRTSVLHLLIIAVDRHLAITSPLLYHVRMTPRRAKVVILTIWAIPVLYFSSQLLYVAVAGFDMQDITCTMDGILPEGFVIFWVAIFFPVPFIIMVILHSHIFWIARKHARRLAVQGQSFENTNYRKNMKAAKTLCIVLSAFVLCWLPLLILITTNRLRRPACGTPWLFFILVSLAVSNSALNPAIYAYRSIEFRESFKKILTRNKTIEIQNHEPSNASAVDRERQDVS